MMELKSIDTIEDLTLMCKNSKEVSKELAILGSDLKNKILNDCADSLIENSSLILDGNKKDIENAEKNLMPDSLKDRLMLNRERIEAMAQGLRNISSLDDPIGNILEMKKRPNGLMIGKKTVPIGVIGVIYEARPNVTSDVFGLCFKTGNASILKGGSAAKNSNIAIVIAIKEALVKNGIDENVISYIDSSDREISKEFMRMNGFVDLIIPRGGAGLIQTVVNTATVPVIETGVGNCHIYVDSSADFNMALDIIDNAKTQRTGVCNAAESLLIHKDVARDFLPLLEKRLKEKNVELRLDKESLKYIPDNSEATEEDWGREYLDLIISVKIVSGLDEAISHINRYNTGHSEAIITNDYESANTFLDKVDSSCVYVNASTRFTDGNEFGFGAEIGISTQKLHARGPMGLDALCTTKYIIYGNGQIRD